MTPTWSRSHLRHSKSSGEEVKTVHTISKCYRCRCGWVTIHVQDNDYQNRSFRCAILIISFTEVVGCVLPPQLCQFLKLHILQPKPLHVLLYHCGDCAHHPAGFVIFAQLALLGLFITLMIPILTSVGSYKITQTISDGEHLSWIAFSGSVLVNPAFWAFLVSPSFCRTGVSASSSRFLALAVTLPT